MKPLRDEELGALFRDFRHSAFRLETLPEYQVPDERADLAAFRAGTLTRNVNEPWVHLVREATTTGKRMQRVRLVSAHLTDYERFELDRYQASIDAGEDILIAHRTPGVFRGKDFWLFADSIAVLMDYDGAGYYVGARLAPADYVVRCRQLRDAWLSRAVPLADYLAVRS
jgi:hypothetical protein